MAKIPGLNTWLHRTDKIYLTQTSSGVMGKRYPALIFFDAQGEPTSNEEWIHAPDVSLVAGFDTKYWIVTGDSVTLITPLDRSAIDAAELEAQRDSIVDDMDRLESYTRAFALAVLDEFNNVSDTLNAILNAADNANNLGDFKSAMVAIADRPQRTVAQLKTAVRNKIGS